MSTRLEVRRIHLTAALTVKYPFHAPGTFFTNRGAEGSVTVTLPTPGGCPIGAWYQFRVHADQSFIVAGASSGKLVAPGNAAARSGTRSPLAAWTGSVSTERKSG
jgi:hypothetical protein